MRRLVLLHSSVALLTAAATVVSVHAETCDADIDASGTVNAADLALLLGAWGPNPGSPADFDDSGIVDAADLAELLGAWGKICVDGIIVTDLAGHALKQYPHFEYVRAFNGGESFDVAIDPIRFPIIAGRTCDLYVIAAQSFAQWQADATLTDVRGAPQAVTLSGSTIQQLTVDVTDSDLLDDDAGIDIGVPYDIVLDCNQNGQLDEGDVIDGDYAGGTHGSQDEEAGLYVVHDLAALGPLKTTGITSTMQLLTGQTIQHRMFYPTNIDSMGQLPLVLIGHGFGHDYPWYDYLQEHLASYGYIAISHQQNFTLGPGVQRVLHVADAVIGNQDVIAGGVLDGHVDSTRISFIGHSRGGEEVAFAADTLHTGLYVPVNYTPDSVKFMSGIGQTTALGPDRGNPHGFTFHVLYGAADGDVDGDPACNLCQPFQHLDRAVGTKLSTYVHGADHNDFNCCGFDNFTGPARTEIGRPEAQRVANAVYLAAHKHFFEGNIPAKDFLWRQWENIRPFGVNSGVTVVSTFNEPPESGKFVIDDFQTNPAIDQSSSGAGIFFDVSNLVENRLDDGNSTFTWMASDPMNGMTYGGPQDTTRGIVFDYADGLDSVIEFEVLPADGDFTSFVNLSFRACQGTRHPATVALTGDQTFSITLIDEDGDESTINIGAYGGGIEEPYARTLAGSGVGWQNEFETVRIRLSDFLNNGSDVDLNSIETVRFAFGSSFGSSQGRLGLDDVELTTD